MALNTYCVNACKRCPLWEIPVAMDALHENIANSLRGLGLLMQKQHLSDKTSTGSARIQRHTVWPEYVSQHVLQRVP